MLFFFFSSTRQVSAGNFKLTSNKTLFLIQDLSGKKKNFLLQKLETWPQFRPDAFRDQTLLIIAAFYMKFPQWVDAGGILFCSLGFSFSPWLCSRRSKCQRTRTWTAPSKASCFSVCVLVCVKGRERERERVLKNPKSETEYINIYNYIYL